MNRTAKLYKEIETLKKELAAEKIRSETSLKQWAEAERTKSEFFGKNLESEKNKKIMLIIDHITAGRSNEAIQALLEPVPVVIGLNIHFADDKTRNSYEDEVLERAKKTMIEVINGLKLKHEDPNTLSTK